jgi:hypothetical protein
MTSVRQFRRGKIAATRNIGCASLQMSVASFAVPSATPFGGMPPFARPVLLLAFLILAAPARAAVITLALEGSVDLSFFGGPSASAFTASMTWDSTVDPSRVDVPKPPCCPARDTWSLNSPCRSRISLSETAQAG